MQVLVFNCSVVHRRSLKLSLVFSAKTGKTKVACHRLAIGLIFLPAVLLVFLFVLFFCLFPAGNLEKDFSESFHSASHVLGRSHLAL